MQTATIPASTSTDATPAIVAAAPVAAKPAKPATPKAAKPAKPKADKPATPAKPAKPAPVATDSDAEAKRIAALRTLARKYYDGASAAAHMRKPAKLSEYVARVSTPVQRIGPSGPSQRDESGLALIASDANGRGVFDPVRLVLDLGIASRLASGGFITVTGETFALTKTGRERANIVIKRAA